MPKYMAIAKYTSEAVGGVRKAGYQSRQQALESMAESLGGKLEAIYFLSSGSWDLLTIMDLPDSAAAFALLSFANSTGVTAQGDVIELLTPAQADAAIARQVKWTAPGERA
jgi:uncharacterized protein with GYD domain